MNKTINFLKSWSARIATLPIIERAFHTCWQVLLGWLLAGIEAAFFSAHPSGDLIASLTTTNAVLLSALKTALLQALKEQTTNIPDGGRS